MSNEYDKLLNKVEKVLGVGTTSNRQLDALENRWLQGKCWPTCAHDEVPLLTPDRPYVIANLDNSSKPGSHWVACVYYSPHFIAVFDSFNRTIKMSLRQRNAHITVTRNNQQHMKEDNCGQRSLAFLLLVDKYGLSNASLL